MSSIKETKEVIFMRGFLTNSGKELYLKTDKPIPPNDIQILDAEIIYLIHPLDLEKLRFELKEHLYNFGAVGGRTVYQDMISGKKYFVSSDMNAQKYPDYARDAEISSEKKFTKQ